MQSAEPAGAGRDAFSSGVLEIRLVGVRPDEGDEVFDVRGKKIAEAPYFGGSGVWGEDGLRRDFIFEMPETDEPILLPVFQEIRPAGEAAPLARWGMHRLYAFQGGPRLVVATAFRRVYRRPWLRFFTRNVPVEAVDFTLRYYHGPRGTADVVFEGPFFPGKTVKPVEGRQILLSPLIDIWTGETPAARFRLSTGFSFVEEKPILAYDKSGRRHRTNVYGGRFGSPGDDVHFVVVNVPLEQISSITIDERPHEQVFRNVIVRYPRRPPRDHAEYLNRIARTLGRDDLDAEALRRCLFQDAEEAIRVIDLVRGPLVHNACHALVEGDRRFDIAALDPDSKSRIRTAAVNWANASDPRIRLKGVLLGIRGNWPRFVEYAMDLLDSPDPSIRRRTAVALRSTGGRYLTANDVSLIAAKLVARDDPATFLPLWDCVALEKSTTTTQVLRKLAGDDRPWLWWRAIDELATRRAFRDRANLPGSLRLRLILVRGPGAVPDGEKLVPRAHSLLAKMLTARCAMMDPGVHLNVLTRVVKRLDREAATTALVDHLADVLRFYRSKWSAEPDAGTRAFLSNRNEYRSLAVAIDRAVKYVNLLNGMNLGQLGTDVYRETPGLVHLDWPTLAQDAIEWRETGRVPTGLPSGYSPKPGDLRLVWKNADDPEKSLDRAWLKPDTPRMNPRALRLASGLDFVTCRIAAGERDGAIRYVMLLTTGVFERRSHTRLLEFSGSDLPLSVRGGELLTPAYHADERGRSNAPGTWEGNWELWIEPLDAEESVLSGSRVFGQRKKRLKRSPN